MVFQYVEFARAKAADAFDFMVQFQPDIGVRIISWPLRQVFAIGVTCLGKIGPVRNHSVSQDFIVISCRKEAVVAIEDKRDLGPVICTERLRLSWRRPAELVEPGWLASSYIGFGQKTRMDAEQVIAQHFFGAPIPRFQGCHAIEGLQRFR